MAIPLGYPPPPREKVSLRSPLSDGGKASSSTGVPIQEATTEGRYPPWVLIDKSPSDQRSGLPQGVTTGSLASRYHQYSSKYSAGACPILTGGMAFFISPFLPAIKFPPRWAWLGGHPGVWMQFHVRSILAPGTAPGRMACRFPREHGKNRSLPAEKERLRKLGVQGGIPPGGVPGLAPGGGIGKGG